ncbi:hypothetical protein [Campylobacter vulpis]|uniref:hypothetical protein n=1 Tax=Campylobacter vulpis TaxID=1655500 RepID=UPI000C156291|nr:hypothetical protein [Campylobacter vulpis]MBS4275606.1 hypothetical protein [Campylobacter vulpis]MBS4306811.1 hypothetical protein [Campylobacter vulpis]MBS4329919.1 hypothetical protein [Campylobacter vulpis]MBS4423566.1 hypothetical protein [Campylobacter vulpis]PHY89909.1 hypothetical protein AA995_07160 [Campylobacter vulpis]
MESEFKAKFKVFANSARVKHFRNLKRLRRFFSKGLNYLITQNFKFLKSKFKDTAWALGVASLKGKIWVGEFTSPDESR